MLGFCMTKTARLRLTWKAQLLKPPVFIRLAADARAFAATGRRTFSRSWGPATRRSSPTTCRAVPNLEPTSVDPNTSPRKMADLASSIDELAGVIAALEALGTLGAAARLVEC